MSLWLRRRTVEARVEKEDSYVPEGRRRRTVMSRGKKEDC